MKITIKGIVGEVSKQKNDEIIYLFNENLKILHGVENDIEDECFSLDYDDTDLKDKISGGYLRFEYDDTKKCLYSIVEYNLIEFDEDDEKLEPITDEEIEELKEYTQG